MITQGPTTLFSLQASDALVYQLHLEPGADAEEVLQLLESHSDDAETVLGRLGAIEDPGAAYDLLMTIGSYYDPREWKDPLSKELFLWSYEIAQQVPIRRIDQDFFPVLKQGLPKLRKLLSNPTEIGWILDDPILVGNQVRERVCYDDYCLVSAGVSVENPLLGETKKHKYCWAMLRWVRALTGLQTGDFFLSMEQANAMADLQRKIDNAGKETNFIQLIFANMESSIRLYTHLDLNNQRQTREGIKTTDDRIDEAFHKMDLKFEELHKFAEKRAKEAETAANNSANTLYERLAYVKAVHEGTIASLFRRLEEIDKQRSEDQTQATENRERADKIRSELQAEILNEKIRAAALENQFVAKVAETNALRKDYEAEKDKTCIIL